MTRFLKTTAMAGILTFGTALPAAAGDSDGDMFHVYTLDQSPEEASAQLRDYTEAEEDWLFLAEFGLAGGKVTALKICYPEIGSDVVAAGMHTMAMMPCGHLAFYEEDGQSKLSMLDLSFMTELYPDPNLENAVATAKPAFTELLSEVLGVE